MFRQVVLKPVLERPPCPTAVKPAAVQKNTVKPAAIEINVRVYYNDYGNHRNNTEETRF